MILKNVNMVTVPIWNNILGTTYDSVLRKSQLISLEKLSDDQNDWGY